MMTQTPDARTVSRICQELVQRQRVLITSHIRPDGDAIGSALAMAFALRSLGKIVRVVNRDPAPEAYLAFPGVRDIEVTAAVEGELDAVVVMECGDLQRTGVTGLERYFVINIDHHLGNTGYGALNWFDATAAACGEMVFDLIERLGVALSTEIATHLYLAILTDTGSFRHSHITARTFEICRRAVEAGVDPAGMSRQVFDNGSTGKLKLIGALLSSMQLAGDGRLAALYLDNHLLRSTNSTYEDTEGLINLPLGASTVEAVVLFRHLDGEPLRVSLRSKDGVDVRQVASGFGGGGHTNAAGFTVDGPYDQVRQRVLDRVLTAIETAHEIVATECSGRQPRGR